MKSQSLKDAKKNKNDEFYTMYRDIEDEMRGYIKHNPKVFKGKTVLLPCDDPEWSNFTKYFAQNFEKLGLKKLISTSYAPSARGQKFNESNQLTLFGAEDNKYDESRHTSHGRIFTLERDRTGNGRIDFDDLEWDYLNGDGDFRSEEVKSLRDQADIIITNPPFSLFRDFLTWINEANKKFIIVGNMNAITYKEVFPLIRNDELWLGFSKSGKKCFEVPDAQSKNAVTLEDGTTVVGLGNTAWFTNIEHGRRYESLILMSKSDNIKHGRHAVIRDSGYQKYDNYNAIDVPFTDAIPSDHKGVMGVPISFLDKYCPEQFEIVKFRHGDDGKDLRFSDGNSPYFRILIRHKRESK